MQDLLKQAINKSLPAPEYFILDWKGLGKEKQKIKELISNFNLQVLRTDQIKKDI